MSKESKKELLWWIKNTRNSLSLRLSHSSYYCTEIHSDASGLAYASTSGVWGCWKDTEIDWNILIKETEALRRTICSLEKGKNYVVKIDNYALFWSLKKGRSRSREVNLILRRIGGDLQKRDLHVDFEWISTKENQADFASRSLKKLKTRIHKEIKKQEGEGLKES